MGESPQALNLQPYKWTRAPGRHRIRIDPMHHDSVRSSDDAAAPVRELGSERHRSKRRLHRSEDSTPPRQEKPTMTGLELEYGPEPEEPRLEPEPEEPEEPEEEEAEAEEEEPRQREVAASAVAAGWRPEWLSAGHWPAVRRDPCRCGCGAERMRTLIPP